MHISARVDSSTVPGVGTKKRVHCISTSVPFLFSTSKGENDILILSPDQYGCIISEIEYRGQLVVANVVTAAWTDTLANVRLCAIACAKPFTHSFYMPVTSIAERIDGATVYHVMMCKTPFWDR